MMNVKLFTLIFLLFALCCETTKADDVKSFTIKGQVVDSLTSETIPYATLRIALAQTPQDPVKLLACDIDGNFETSLTRAGKYIISLQSIGKAPAQKFFTLSDKTPKLNLGHLYMKEDNTRLDEVTVTAQKPLVKVEIDKLSYSLEDDPEAQTNNTLDMLRKVPMVTVDGEDKIQLKGSSNYKIYMNGKPSNLLSNQNASDVLKGMPASSIKRIEVITDPGAKYDAEGIGGIINIITTKNALQGYTGTVRADASTLGQFGGGGYVSAKFGKLGLTANYNYRRQRTPWTDAESERTTRMEGQESYLLQTGRSKRKGPFQFGALEASFEFDTLNLLSVSANLFDGNMKNNMEYDVKNWKGLKPEGDPTYSYRRNSFSKTNFGSTDVNVDFQHSTSRKDELLTFSYRYSHAPDNSEEHTELFDRIGYPSTGYPQWNLNDAATDEHTGQLDYTRPMRKNQTLEVGGKYIFRQSNSDILRQVWDEGTGKWNDVSATNSDFKHTQHIYSAYLGYMLKLTKYGFRAGVRTEGTRLNVKYARDAAMNFHSDYFDVVPNASVSYQLSMSQQLRIGYNMRIQRPGIWYLNPYVNTIDPQNISYGNPKLDSEKSHTVDFNYSMFAQKVSLNVSASYSFVNNSIEAYSFVREDGVTVTTYDNIGKRQDGGLFVYGSWNPVPLFRIYLNGGVNYIDMRTNSSDAFDRSNNGFVGRVYAGTQFNFPKDFVVGVNGGYSAPWITLQGKSSAFYFTGIYVNKSFLKKKLTVGMNLNSPFWDEMKMTQTTSDPAFDLVSTNRWKMRDLRFTISYKFGTMKEAIKKVRRGISNDDLKGGGGAAGGGQEGM